MVKKQIATKTILGLTIFFFVLSFSNFVFPIQVSHAANTGLNWENPNANGTNPYKVTTDAILNSQTMMQVVGCTGLVDKVTGAITNFVKDKAKEILKTKAEKIKELANIKACDVKKAALLGPTGLIPQLSISTTLENGYKCPVIFGTQDKELTALQKEDRAKEDAKEKRESCFNGLAYTLAKNQLTSMTRETVNWVNQGFNGNPLYVQNIRSLTNSIERNVIETGIDVFANGAFPYGETFNNTLIKSYNGGSMNGAAKYLDSLTSDLAYFLTDTKSYTDYDSTDTNYARQRAIQANNAFSNDFSVGGWDGYLALTQREQNNPLGFTMEASQYIANRIEQQSNETKSEVVQNNGFLNQKECILWQVYDQTTQKPKTKETGKVLFAGITGPSGLKSKDIMETIPVTSPKQQTYYDKCLDWKTTTPGSLIKDKLTTYINSPERQLELADDINKSLSGLFTKLIENFRGEGLFGLSQEKYSGIDSSIGGYGVNSTGIDTNLGSGYSPSYYANGSGYNTESFDLTRDLGNTYIHDDTLSLGNWNARTNTPELNIDLGPSYINSEQKRVYYPSGYYYIVYEAGNTKLFNNGYSGWAVGDRVFWDGTKWQNWKKIQTSPIAKRGIIQTQEDYIVAAREILKVLPSIMPRIAELDYCIPGPNPSFENNSSETGTLFNQFAGSLQSVFNGGSFFTQNSSSFTIAKAGDPLYDNYANIFKWNPNLWENIKKTTDFISLGEDGGVAGKTFNSNATEDEVMTRLSGLLLKIEKNIKTFYTDYTNLVFKAEYEKMRSKYIENESTGELLPNSSYVPMIEDGYVATKDIISTNEELATADQDYRDAIVEAQSNSNKLNIIRKEVGAIIQKAQQRRDVDPAFNNSLLSYYQGKTLDQAKALYATYKIANKKCFEEENISYYDSDSLMVSSTELERCNDSMDNDLDGLIDRQDPDCSNSKAPNITTTTNTNNITTTGGLGFCEINKNIIPKSYQGTAINDLTYDEGVSCELRIQENCIDSKYYSNNGLIYTCKLQKNINNNLELQ